MFDKLMFKTGFVMKFMLKFLYNHWHTSLVCSIFQEILRKLPKTNFECTAHGTGVPMKIHLHCHMI